MLVTEEDQGLSGCDVKAHATILAGALLSFSSEVFLCRRTVCLGRYVRYVDGTLFAVRYHLVPCILVSSQMRGRICWRADASTSNVS